MRGPWIILVALAVALLNGCGSSDDPPASTGSDAGDAIDVIDLMRDQPQEEVILRGILFDDGTGLVVCEVLAESFPPQCVGDRVAVSGVDPTAAEFNEEGDVRWTDSPVELRGRLVAGRFEVVSG